MTRFKTKPRGKVVTIAATICTCVATTVFSYHFGYLQGTRETIENSSLVPIVPEHFAPMPTEDPIETRLEFRRNSAGELEFVDTA